MLLVFLTSLFENCQLFSKDCAVFEQLLFLGLPTVLKADFLDAKTVEFGVAPFASSRLVGIL